MKKVLILLAAMALSLTPLMGQGRERVSILGDSYSTFVGYIPAEYEQWYTGDTKMTDVTDVRQTWWWQVVKDGACLLHRVTK